MIRLASVLLAASAFISNPAPVEAQKKKPPQEKVDSTYGTELPVLAGALIEIKSYDPETRTFVTFSPELPGEGNHVVSPEALRKAIDSFDYRRATKNPSSLIGVQFKIDRDLPRLFRHEKAARRKAKSKKSMGKD